MAKVYIKTFGCQMNERDSERVLALASSCGYTEAASLDEADLIVINTCTVRRKPEQKVYSLLGRLGGLKERRPHLRIAVVGCLAQQEGDGLLERFPQVDLVLGPDRIGELPRALEALEGGERLCLVGFHQDPCQGVLLPLRPSVRAYVNIMQGCDNFCTYCIVPYVRGPEKSRPSGEIIEEVRLLAERGVKEVTLLGQNVNSYGKKSPGELTFPQLLSKIDQIEGIERIRFTTSHPKDLSEELIRAFVDLEKLCEHLHLPFQAGSNRVLERMGRAYTREEYLRKVERLRQLVPRVAITADVMVGFPGEGEEDFRQTLELVREVEFDALFSFKYTPRKGTVASRWPDDVSPEEKQRRLEELQELQRAITLRKNRSLEGQVMEVLVEGTGGRPGQLRGRTRCNRVVNFPGGEELVGRLLWVRITEGLQNSLRGELCPLEVQEAVNA